MTREERSNLIDKLEQLRFFNQRAGRELWGDKSRELQNEDIKNADTILDMAILALSENKGDLISRKLLLNKINAYVVGSQDKEFICKLIKEMPSIENKREWIPVTERLPDNNVIVLCSAISTSISGGYTRFVGCCNNGFWFVQTDAETVSYPRQYEVLAWQPLPEPYKAESEVKPNDNT